MNQLKKFFAAAGLVVMISITFVLMLVYLVPYSFDPQFKEALQWMNQNGFTSAATERDYRPYDNLTRKDAAKLFVEFDKKYGNSVNLSGLLSNCSFDDINNLNEEERTYIYDGCQRNLIKGFNGKFMPDMPFTKAAAITVLIRIEAGKMDETVVPWWDNYFKKAQQLGITKETNTNALDTSVSRGEIALMLYRSTIR